jgi:ABC-type lipoprotein export system ATPase subunit
MRVRNISVTGLFGIFDHEIPLQEEGRITIIHGLNGIGKTIVLRMIHEALTGKETVLRSVPFDRFQLAFGSGETLVIEKDGLWSAMAGGPRVYPDLKYTLNRADHSQVVFRSTSPPKAARRSRSKAAADSETKPPDWLAELRKAMVVRLVETGRLHVSSSYTPASALEKCGEDLGQRIRDCAYEYSRVSGALESSFPRRALTRTQGPSLSAEALRAKLTHLERARARLSGLGLWDVASRSEEVPWADDAQGLSIVSLYVDDAEKKLHVFDDLAGRIELLLRVIGERFRYKKLAVSRLDGMTILAESGTRVPLSMLSSGEQHELVMFYELLFRTKPDTLVLIDEPEISLHLAWQQRFLDDLEDVVKFTDVDILIATHSADIIDRHWDWTVSLEGPKA